MKIDFVTLRDLSSRMACLGSQWREMCDELKSAGYGHVPDWMRAEALRYARSCGGEVALERYWDEYARERLAGLAGPVDVRRGVFPAATAYRSQFMEDLRQKALAWDPDPTKGYSSPYFEPSLRKWDEEMTRGGTLETQGNQKRLLLQNAARDQIKPEFKEMHKDIYDMNYKNFMHELSTLLDKFSYIGNIPGRSHGFRKKIKNTEWTLLLRDSSSRTIEYGFLQFWFAVYPSDIKNKSKLTYHNFCSSFTPREVFPFWNYHFDPKSIEQFHYMVREISEITKIISCRLDRVFNSKNEYCSK